MQVVLHQMKHLWAKKKKDRKKLTTEYTINQLLKYKVSSWFKEIQKIKQKAHER